MVGAAARIDDISEKDVALKLEESARETLRRSFRKTLKKALGAFTPASAIDPRIAHDARRHLKHLKSLLFLMGPLLDRSDCRRASRTLRNAARTLATTRRNDAMIEVAQKLLERSTDGDLARALGALKGKLADFKDQANGRAVVPEDIEEIRHRLDRLRRRARSWRLSSGRRHLLDGLAEAYSKTRRHLRDGLGHDDIVELHEGRKFAIFTLHHLEWLEPLWPALLETWTRELDGLRGLLGDVHDLHELLLLLERDPSIMLPEPDMERVRSAIRAREDELKRGIASAAGRLYAERPGAFRARIGRLWKAFEADVEQPQNETA